jgi:hypothetical protein
MLGSVHRQERRLLRALDVFPQSADLNSIYGDVQFFLRHDMRTAYTHYAIALESDPEHAPAACGLATAMLDLGVQGSSPGTEILTTAPLPPCARARARMPARRQNGQQSREWVV